MRVAVFGTKPYDRSFFERANAAGGRARHELTFWEPRLAPDTFILARGCDAVCVFVNDDVSAATVEGLAQLGVGLIALRCAGFNHVDLHATKAQGLRVVRVPAYSPHAVAEHTVALMLSLNRKIHRAYNRVREGNFSLHGLLGFDMCGRQVGIVGTGTIGTVVARVLSGFGCRIVGHDQRTNPEFLRWGGVYVELPQLWTDSDIITLHCPLTHETRHLVNEEAIASMRRGVMLINTSRGAVIDTEAVLRGLKRGDIGSLGLDVYEEEANMFFEDLSHHGIEDDVLARLTTFPNVLITGHQGFFTREAMQQIAATTLENISQIERHEPCDNEVHLI